MLDQNGKFTLLDRNAALVIVGQLATVAGVGIKSGSSEEQIENWMAQLLLKVDAAQYQSNLKEFNPTGSDIDLQNPNIPRLPDKASTGFLKLTNGTLSPIIVLINSIFTAPNGNEYSTFNSTVTVPASNSAFISVQSVETGAAQNLPSGQSFTSDYDLTVVNPQPFVDGRDKETDTQYLTRLTLRKTNLVSEHATAAAEEELDLFYEDARIYVNNTSNALITPVPVPPNGYTPVVLFPSGVTAGAEEIHNALRIISNHIQFGNPLVVGTTLHPVLSGTIYSGSFPQVYYVLAAQAVKFTLNASLSITFPANVDAKEKKIQAAAFARFFVQNVVNFIGGASGKCHVTYNPLSGPDVLTDEDILSAIGDIRRIGPVFSLETVRSLIQDAVELSPTSLLIYLSCDDLVVDLDPQQAGESTITMDINDPYTPQSVDFKTTALFTDGTSWFDRYMYIDPDLISVTVTESSI